VVLGSDVQHFTFLIVASSFQGIWAQNLIH
jgi:hypothetical protein